jgi:hypothetical protein
LTIQIHFKRIWTNQFISFYLPSGLCVLVTCLTFWFGLDTTSERLTVGAYNLLILITMFVITIESLPPNQTLTGLDWWILFCILLTLLQLLEQIIIHDLYLQGCIRDSVLERAALLKKVQEQQTIQQQNAFNELVQQFYDRKHFLPRSASSRNSSTTKSADQPLIVKTNVARAALSNEATKQLLLFQQTLAFNCFVCRRSDCDNRYHVPFRLLLCGWRKLQIRCFKPTDPEYLPLMIDRFSRFFFLFSLVIFCTLYYPLTIYVT